jgi:glycogen debranching enzyme
LLQPFCIAYIKLYKKSGVPLLKRIYEGFEPILTEYGVGSIGEIFDANPPHKPRGAVSQAWSVAALITIEQLINDYSK